jgi:hypothetical protein
MSVIIRQTTRRRIQEHRYLLTETLAALNLGRLKFKAIFLFFNPRDICAFHTGAYPDDDGGRRNLCNVSTLMDLP